MRSRRLGPIRPGPCARSGGLGRRSSSARRLLRAASAGSIQGRKSAGARFGKRQQQVAQVALGIDGDRRDAVDGRFFEQREAQARLAAAGHADADGVRGQILRVVQQQLVAQLLRRRVEFTAQVEDAELLEVRHRDRPARYYLLFVSCIVRCCDTSHCADRRPVVPMGKAGRSVLSPAGDTPARNQRRPRWLKTEGGPLWRSANFAMPAAELCEEER